MTYVKTTRIRFADCDPAGIVFYPRYFEMFNEVVEDWFADQLGAPFSELIVEGGASVPLAHIEVDFTRPSALGDLIAFTLTVERLGRSSIRLQIVGACRGEARLKARLVLVHARQEDGRPAEIPGDLRAAIEDHMGAARRPAGRHGPGGG